MEKFNHDWITADGNYRAQWKEPEMVMYPEIAEILKQKKQGCLIYHHGCGICATIIFSYSQQTQHTIESLERRISELERELEERPVVTHTSIIQLDAVKKIFGENEKND